MDKTSIETRKTLLGASTDRIRRGVEDNLRYAYLARKDTMDLKSRSIHSIYEARMQKLNSLIQQEMDLLQHNLARMIAEDRVSVRVKSLVDPKVIDRAVENRKAEVRLHHADTEHEIEIDLSDVDPKYIITAATGELEKVDSPVDHGKVYTYSKRKCRCTPCKKAKSDNAQMYRQQKLEREAAEMDMREKNTQNA